MWGESGSERAGAGSVGRDSANSGQTLNFSVGSVGGVEFGLPGGALSGVGNAPPISDPQSAARQEVAKGDVLYHQGRFADAVIHYRAAARLVPHEPVHHYKLAMAAWRVPDVDTVERHLHEAARIAPGDHNMQEALGQWYLNIGNIEAALFHSERSIQLAPHDPGVIESRAFVLEGSGQFEGAYQLIKPLLAAGFCSGWIAALYGRLAPRINQEPEALSLIARALRMPGGADAQTALLHYTAAELLDRLGRYDEAFEHARLANDASRRPYDPRKYSYWVDHRIEYYTPAKLHDLPRASHRNRRPVFIVGMPRSGTSLVEQILASHPQVYGAGELDTLSRISSSALNAGGPEGTRVYPDCLDAISLREANKLAGEYLSVISALNLTATYVTDKMPLNFMYLGLIALLFPEAHVIHCTRNPMDTCLSCYFTNFAIGYDFSFDLGHLATFYRDYRRLMEHWRTVLNFPMLEVKYEAVVSDVEGQTRRLLEFLDLPWDERCLGFHQNARHVATASKHQVRRPIYGSSVGRWKHYEKYLAPLATLAE